MLQGNRVAVEVFEQLRELRPRLSPSLHLWSGTHGLELELMLQADGYSWVHKVTQLEMATIEISPRSMASQIIDQFDQALEKAKALAKGGQHGPAPAPHSSLEPQAQPQLRPLWSGDRWSRSRVSPLPTKG